MSLKKAENLRIWREAHALTLLVYKVSAGFPSDERFGLTRQLRRAAYSVPANIVEGNARRSAADYQHFLRIAKGSVQEARYFCRLAMDLGLAPKEKLLRLIDRYSGLDAGIAATIAVLEKRKADRT